MNFKHEYQKGLKEGGLYVKNEGQKCKKHHRWGNGEHAADWFGRATAGGPLKRKKKERKRERITRQKKEKSLGQLTIRYAEAHGRGIDGKNRDVRGRVK